MSITKFYRLTCDVCGEIDLPQYRIPTDIGPVRAVAAEDGWKNEGKVDYCPACARVEDFTRLNVSAAR